MIQTWMPEHPSIRFSKEHDFLNFYAHEKQCRAEFHYPPYRSLVNIIIRSHDEKKAYFFAREIRDVLKKEFSIHNPRTTGDVDRETCPEIEIVGPAPLPFYKLRGHFRWHVMLKIPKDLAVTPKIHSILMGLKKPSAVAFQLDVDPMNIL